jgi:predicted HTH transcriptional regulator
MNVVGKEITNFDQFNALVVNSTPPDDFEFNAILWYYDVEIDMRLKAYFAEHQLMTRADFQRICGFMRSKAAEHLKRLNAEGKIENIGRKTQPIYVPAAGYYGVSRDRIVTR